MGCIGKCRASAALAAVATVLAFVPVAQATFPGQNGKIAFSGAGGINVVEPDGTGQTLLIAGGQDPAWSADGSRLAYTALRSFIEAGGMDPGGVYVANRDGSGQTRIKLGSFSSDGQVTREDMFNEPAWSPDGGTVAYEDTDFVCAVHVACHEGPQGVRAVGPDGSGDHMLLPSPASDPAYSPDGTRIAWSEHLAFSLSAIHVSNSDGTGDTVLTAADPNTGDGMAFDPSWSPDGTRIAFTNLQTANNSEIYTMNANGSNQTRLTFSEAPDDVDPVWSPDGTKIAWTRDGVLWVMNVDGSRQAPLGADPIRVLRPDWQPLVGPQRGDYKNASHFCKAEREFVGDAAFRVKYGNHGGCVSGR